MLHIALLVMNRLYTAESAILISLVYSLLARDLTIQNLFIFTAASAVLCGGLETSPHSS